MEAAASSMNTGWLFVALIAGAAGMGLFIYGVRQHEPVSLIFGVAFSGYPYVVYNTWLAALIGIVLAAAFVVVKKKVY